jgi:NCAIR mutase (PurE)-related protein
MYTLREVLDKVAKKEISPSDAETLLKLCAVDEVGCIAKLDGNRELRKGIPEIVLAEGKTASDVAEIACSMLAKNGRVIVSRCSKEQVQAIREAFSSDVDLEINSKARMVLVKKKNFAGIHRLLEPLKEVLSNDVDVVVVVAGREGALASVVSGLVDVPVIAVPTSNSYGFGEKGLSALMAMLQSCSLGLAVVNIDSGVAAGSMATLIANRAAKFRK